MASKRDYSAVVLIGPVGVGKTTAARILARMLKRPAVHMDLVAWDYYCEGGFDREQSRRAEGQDGIPGSVLYMERFVAYAVERVLDDYPGHIVDFGGGHSVCIQKEYLERVQKALAPYPDVVLLLPSPDLGASARVLKARNAGHPWLAHMWEACKFDANAHFLLHPSNYSSAKRIVYTEGKTPEETAGEIVSRIAQPRSVAEGSPAKS